MSNSSKPFYRVIAFICGCLIGVCVLFATGIIEPPSWLDFDGGKSDPGNNYSGPPSEVPSALSIELTGDYLTAFQKSSQTLATDDTKSLILIKVALQILQSKTISYKNALHFYSLEYENSGGTAGAKTYSLVNCINRINDGNRIYTDCFGFVRLVHSITCYTINKNNPSSVSGLSSLYGWKGAYSEGKTFSSINSFKSGAVIYDTITGTDAGYSSSNRHVGMFLYVEGSNIVYIDQGGIKRGQSKGTYIYSAINSVPYKFNKFKNYN